MPNKYAEITVIKEEESIFRTLSRFVGFCSVITENDTIIMTFDEDCDGTVYNTKDEYMKTPDKKVEFSSVNYNDNPVWFSTSKRTLFVKSFVEYNGEKRLNFNNMFANNRKYNSCKKIPSIYNVIYYVNNICDTTDAFGIVRMQSSEEKPRFMIAYDDEIFDRSDILYLVHCTLTGIYSNK